MAVSYTTEILHLWHVQLLSSLADFVGNLKDTSETIKKQEKISQ